MTSPIGPKGSALRGWLIIIAASAICIGIVTHRDEPPAAWPHSEYDDPPPPAAVKPVDPEADKMAIAVRKAALYIVALRADMRNPESFRLSRVLLMPKGALCFEYRAQNGFGGMNLENAVMNGAKFWTEGMAGYDGAAEKYRHGTGTIITGDVQALIPALK